jgi:hypothetical protein
VAGSFREFRPKLALRIRQDIKTGRKYIRHAAF